MAEKALTRFAPSPTGYLHVGGARTALFNWLYARHAAGEFILRIEDTDQKRNTPEAMDQVIADLKWLGLDWDQGPGVEGPNGPYLQSQRRDIYERYIRKLIEEGKAYYCFDTAEELNAMRKKAQAEKKGFLYPRPEKLPGEKDAEKAIAEGRDVTVRFLMPAREIVVKDVVRGEVKFGAGEFSDFIIQKSDGFPTYNFACVVDDALMGVTHVIRGQEHLMNTPGQQELWKALFSDIDIPTYAHMSVTVSESGGKLSKRERPKALLKAIKARDDVDLDRLAEVGGISSEAVVEFVKGKSAPEMSSIDAMSEYLEVHLPEINVVDFFRSGYLPETMTNFLALLGWNPGDEREIMPVEELTKSFDISRLNKTNSLFDRQKLVAFNTEYIKIVDKEKLLVHFKSYLKEIDSPLCEGEDELLTELLAVNEGARTLEQIEQKCRFLFYGNDKIEYDEKAVRKVLLKGTGLEMLKIVRERLAAMGQISEKGLEDMLRGLAEENGVGLGKVAQPLRVAICGATVSPPIFNSVKILGKENTLLRIDNTIKKFSIETEEEGE
ncbi:MAG: glutamate--tRNA ligase [Planctomycetota bacterium]|jgi:glutamyl-tRNA synthetase